jgi:cyclic beta-1,2-glucan synthetase
MKGGAFGRSFAFAPRRADFWQDTHAIRADLFGAERLEHHAISLALEQKVARARGSARRLFVRIRDNAAVLHLAYQAGAASLGAGHSVTPAAEWLLDNFHVIEAQLRSIKTDLPRDYFHQLPKLTTGPFAGYPRVLELASAYVAHSDSFLSMPVLAQFVRAYQTIQPLSIGELWAIPITLRIVMIENMRRIAAQIMAGQALRLQADNAAQRAQVAGGGVEFARQIAQGFSDDVDFEIFAAQISKRLRVADPRATPLLVWLQDQLTQRGLTLDAVAFSAQLRQGATSVTMRNLVTSLRLMSQVDWADFFEDVSLIDAQLCAAFDFSAMDFATRNSYRTAIETLARGAQASEADLTAAALGLCANGDPGRALIGPQRQALERALGFAVPWRLSLRRAVQRAGLGGYLGSAALVSACILAGAVGLSGATGWAAIGLALVGVASAFEAGLAAINLGITRSFTPQPLPSLALEGGIEPQYRTLVVIPVMLTNADDLRAHVAALQVHYLSSIGGAVSYAILSDYLDAPTQRTAADAPLLALAQAEIAALNSLYPSDDGPRFAVLHRMRKWNSADKIWMGWERKRGKLDELNRLLRGAQDTSFDPSATAIAQDIRYVITLDEGTRLPRDTVRQLIGKMAHPLNHAQIDAATGRVSQGYGILQPRVSASLPSAQSATGFARIFASHGGIEPYVTASSDVYQDLFGQGSFTGKGIYDVDAFRAAMAGRVPDNTMLSHDLFEGIFARAGLASDVQLIEDFPARYDVDSARMHRWARGDWQLLPWITGRRRALGGLGAVGQWKMLDNLRRSLLAPCALLGLAAGWAGPHAPAWTAIMVVIIALPYVLGLPFAAIPRADGATLRSHGAALLQDCLLAFARVGLNLMLLPSTAASMLDAVIRSLVRLGTGKNMLQWRTAAQTSTEAAPSLAQTYARGSAGLALGFGVCAAALLLRADSWPLIAPFAAAWIAAPAVMRTLSQTQPTAAAQHLSPKDAQTLRLIARRTWRYFETFVTQADNFLPPDNFQETPKPALARRTSPTNIGLYLLSVTAAHDMGWISQAQAATRLAQTLATMHMMPRHRGHLFNWHDTADLHVMEPPYISSVDSGNLAGHLIAVAQTCEAWIARPAHLPSGAQDARAMAQEALLSQPDFALGALLAQIEAGANDALMAAASVLLADMAPGSDAAFYTRAMIDSHAPELAPLGALHAIADSARAFAMGMDFAFLVQPQKKLLSLGFNVATNTLDLNCYDLLASEARLASLFAIAKGDVETRHWFRLGRAATPVGAGAALMSWSGSMFEYLMPALVMRAPADSMLARSNARAVQRQQSYGAQKGVPWGISESAYNARDLHMSYQYSNFGVPGLGLKRGLGDNLVVAPYATALAAMVNAPAALTNFAALRMIGAQGQFGFYEALDFTPARLLAGQSCAIIRSYMAHHQGMTIAALVGTVQDGLLRTRFHAEPMIQAVELLLQERAPRTVALPAAPPPDLHSAPQDQNGAPSLRRFDSPQTAMPTAHILSNGSYSVTLSPLGDGFSRWRDLSVTRGSGGAGNGSYIFLRDAASGAVWSSAAQPLRPQVGAEYGAVFSNHEASFTHQTQRLITKTEILVSGEDDAEARRVTLTNTGRFDRDIDVTSYSELVLAPKAADLAHPAFSKLFVVTDFLPELGVLIATRRRRTDSEQAVWAAHIAVVEGEEVAPLQYETDRAKFIGRGQNLAAPVMAAAPLSGTVGTVLDPIFSLRRRLRVPAGGRVRITFWTMLAPTDEILLDMVDRHRDKAAFGRAATLAWTTGQVQLHHQGITSAEAADFQRLAGAIICNDPALRAAAAMIAAHDGPQSRLWPLGISGDLPIVLFIISDTEDIAQLRQILAAQGYWRMRQFAVDLVILNDRGSSYVQNLQSAIDAAIRAARSAPPSEQTARSGAIFSLRRDLLAEDARNMLMAVAHVILHAARGGIADQMGGFALRSTQAHLPAQMTLPITAQPPAPILPSPALLEFFNGLGGFAQNGREYVTVLDNGATTPAPWINVIANPSFGFTTSAEGAGFVFSQNSRENQITPWSNDPVTDPSGEVIYLQDLDSRQIWTPTALPIRSMGRYTCRHGFGYSVFEHTAHQISAEMIQFVPVGSPVKITRLRLTNKSARARRLSVTAYAQLVLGTSPSATAGKIITEICPKTGAILARNPRAIAFAGRTTFADFGADVSSFTCARATFLGKFGEVDAPAALIAARPLDGVCGPALDACAALQREIVLEPGQTMDLHFMLGQTDDAAEAAALIAQVRGANFDDLLQAVVQHWSGLLGAVQVRTPDRAMDIMLNGWLLYQTISCRIWARAGFYQASGAFGFRDQLQDHMALAALHPQMTRAHILRAAGRQFPQGDVQHWWLPHSGAGVRTRISDDRVWLAYAAAHYLSVTGDRAIFDEIIPFIDGPMLPADMHDDFFQPSPSDHSASLLQHCILALDQAIELTGQNGLPLMGTGDWNDGMNRVGAGGQGTSVWLGWLLIATLRAMAPHIQAGDLARAAKWRAHADSVAAAIEATAWDGAWYQRGTYDDGSRLGAASSAECQIDSIAQSWAVLSGAAQPARAEQAMASLDARLIDVPNGLALLFAPPFDKSAKDPGYIKAYPPGLRENGGQYTHAATWAILAKAKLKDGDGAQALFALLNPINHALSPDAAARYKVEPYVLAADVYAAAPHIARGGWTWYTGSAAWLQRAGIEGILGMTRAGADLILDPCIPKDWPEYTLTLEQGQGGQSCVIAVQNPNFTGSGVASAQLNGADVPITEGKLILPFAALTGRLTVQLM